MILNRAFWLLGIAIFLLIIFLPGYTKLQELREKNRDLQVKIKQLKIENSLLEQELKYVENDPVYQEKLARDKIGIVRKGEIPLKLVPQEKNR